MNKTRKSPRSIANAIKRGEGSRQIIDKHGFDDLMELQNFIKASYRESEALLSSLAKNDERNTIRRRRAVFDPEPVELDIVEPTEPAEAETLEAKRDRLSDEAVALEVEHKAIVSQRKAIVDSFVELRRELKDMELKVKELGKKILKKEEKAGELGAKMNELSSKHSAVMAELSAVRGQIAEKNKLIVLVSSDGTIDVCRGNEPLAIEFEGWEEKRDSMYNDESGKYEELSKKQLGVLAKLCILKSNFQNSLIEFTIDAPYKALQGLIA
ncbi:MAG: hypothetical protein K6G36_02325 [Candidatus Saccharibacteria bacterium]|nr:hypothetical protein [Candidatus Saccharibacteria bacterium]